MKPINNQSDFKFTIEEIELRVVKEFLDVIMLYELNEQKELSGYDLAILQNQKFNLSLSPGTVYATLYNMERRGLITGHLNGKKTTFTLTPKGLEAIFTIKKSNGPFRDFLFRVFPDLNSSK